ncbi:MAG: flagellar hook-basal body protein [Phycisphaerales bacterium]|nr:flagellar hook-basal body protein [Phycisphaerales bacterium]
MNYGLNLAASGVMTSMYRQDVLANNLANVETVAFKADLPFTRQRGAVRAEDGLGHLPSNEMLERLGGGVLLMPNRTNFEQGAVLQNGNDMNLAIEGEGFFVASSGQGSDSERYRLTRDGRLALDDRGRLVTAGEGLPVLDTNDRPITLDAGLFTIERDGTVRQGGDVVAQLQLATVPDTATLQKAGGNLFKAPATTIASRRPATGSIVQGAVEQSTVDPIEAIMGITSATSNVQNNARMIQMLDELMGRAINTFGRVA